MSPDGDTTTKTINVLTSQPPLAIPLTPINPSLSQITGTTIPGAIVSINNMSINVDNYGNFIIPSTLQNGSYAVNVTDQAGNKNCATLQIKITPPMLSVVFNASFCSIQGSTDVGATLTIGGQSCIVDENGRFTFSSSFMPGIYLVVAQDQAGNTSTRNVCVTSVLLQR